jgi:hypothetical protein
MMMSMPHVAFGNSASRRAVQALSALLRLTGCHIIMSHQRLSLTAPRVLVTRCVSAVQLPAVRYDENVHHIQLCYSVTLSEAQSSCSAG